MLITSELVTNAVRHAGTELTVRVRAAASEVRIEVTDGATEREPHLAAPDAGATGGVGLAIVEKLADAWGVEQHPDGKAVWVSLATAGQ